MLQETTASPLTVSSRIVVELPSEVLSEVALAVWWSDVVKVVESSIVVSNGMLVVGLSFDVVTNTKSVEQQMQLNKLK